MNHYLNLRLFDGDGTPAASDGAPTASPLETARAHRSAAAQRYVQAQAETWTRAAETLSERCPGFDLHEALTDETFCALLRAGVPLDNAYFALHADALLHAAICRASQQAEQRVAEHIRVRGARPGENGLGPGGGIVVRPDVSRMSRADRADIARRAARGEQVKLHL